MIGHLDNVYAAQYICLDVCRLWA